MAKIVILADGRRLITSNGSLNKGKRRAKGAPVVESNNRADKRAAMAHIAATPKLGPNNHSRTKRKETTRARFK